jgi:type IV secretory pathway VirB4 component
MPEDRRRHVYVIGKTGMGKSTLLENMIFDDINK